MCRSDRTDRRDLAKPHSRPCASCSPPANLCALLGATISAHPVAGSTTLVPCQNSIPARQGRFFLWRSQVEAQIERKVWRRRTPGPCVPSRSQEHQLRQPPQPTDGNPEELVKQIESRPRTTSFQHGQLRSQHEVFKDEILTVTEDSKERPEREPEQAEHNPIYNKSDGIREMLCY